MVKVMIFDTHAHYMDEAFAVSMFDKRVLPYSPPGGISYFDRHALATMRYAALHSILQNRMQVVASASALRNT